MSAPVFSDDRVRLRPLAEADLAAYLGAFREDGELAELLGLEADPTEEWLRSQLERQWRDPPELRSWKWTVADADGDDFLGAAVLHSCDWKNRRAEAGFWVVPAARGRGVATAALRLVLEWAFEQAGVERMELTALPGNDPVARIAERLGFAYEGTLRQRNFERGRRVDVLIWGLLRDDFREQRRARGSTAP